jgi:hypothetical protein
MNCNLSSPRGLLEYSYIASSRMRSPEAASIFFSFPESRRGAAYIYLLDYYQSLYLNFNNVFWKAVPTQVVTIQLAFLLFVIYSLFLS